jgi:polygalacturonase
MSLAFVRRLALLLNLLPLVSSFVFASDPATPTEQQRQKQAIFNVVEFGASGEGKAKDTAALQKALDACAASGGGIVLVPAGVYLTGSLQLKSNTTLNLEKNASLVGTADIEDYPLTRVRWEGEFAEGHRALIWADKADHISILGPGSIFGPPISLSRLRNPRGPALIEPSECTNVVFDGFTAQYQRLWAIHPVLCQAFIARNLIVRSVSTNGDGIDIDSCRDVTIEHCTIDAGDDAIALKSGRGLEAVRAARPTEDVVIRDCVLTSSLFAAIGIGTELSGGIRNVRIQNCTLSGKGNGIVIKSRDGRGAFVENITGENLIVLNSPTFLSIDLLKRGIQAKDPVPGAVDQWTQVRNLRFTNIQVHDVKQLVSATKIPAERPVQGLVITNVTGNCEQAIALAHATDVALSGIAVTGYKGLLISTEDVKGTGLSNPATE